MKRISNETYLEKVKAKKLFTDWYSKERFRQIEYPCLFHINHNEAIPQGEMK